MKNPAFFMCGPDYFDIKYSINPWMNSGNPPDKHLAYQQWDNLYCQLRSLGATVEIIPPCNYPDMVYIADSGIIHQNIFYTSNFRFKERRKESPFWKSFFGKYYKVACLPDKDFYEGSGDSCIVGDKLFCGYGFRTAEKSAYKISKMMGLKPCLLELLDKNFYHLDTCFAPLDAHHALFYPPALSLAARKTIEDHFNCYAVPDTEALNFACNIVSFHRKVLIPENCPLTMDLLNQLGFEPYAIELSEFIKAGGASKCLTLRTTPLS
jgi:N-dimethylarginine dimethylaminohydrolase